MRNSRIAMTRVWKNKQIGREFKTILSGHLFILSRLVRIERILIQRVLKPPSNGTAVSDRLTYDH